jgi:hypothetical protein
MQTEVLDIRERLECSDFLVPAKNLEPLIGSILICRRPPNIVRRCVRDCATRFIV